MLFRFYSGTSSLGFGWGGGDASVLVVERNHRQTAGHSLTALLPLLLGND